MASSPEKPKKSIESSKLPPLPPNIYLAEEDLFQNECRIPNYYTGFQTAPSSPPHSNSAHPSPTHKEGGTEMSSSSPKLLQHPCIGPSQLLLQGRDAVPSHHLLKIESFSSLSKAPIEKYSSEFEAGGYKWNLSIYPNGDKNKDGEGHISIYLDMVETSSLPADATVRRFHCLKTQWGIVNFMDVGTFNNPSNGYLVNDTCSFGVEVFVIKTTSKAERLSMIKNPPTHKILWNFPDVSKIKSTRFETERFVAGDYKWWVWFFPNGYQEEGKGYNNNITIALKLDTSILPAGTKLFVHYTFRVMNQKKGKHFERSDSNLISSPGRGFRDFMSQAKFEDPEEGFLVDDTCIIEAEFKVLGLVTQE